MERKIKDQIKFRAQFEADLTRAKIKAADLEYFFDNIEMISEEVVLRKQSLKFAVKFSFWAGASWLTSTLIFFYILPVFRKGEIVSHKFTRYIFDLAFKAYFKIGVLLIIHGIYLLLIAYHYSYIYTYIYEGWVLDHKILNHIK